MDFYYKCKRRIVKTLNFVLVLIIAVSGHLLASNGYDVKVIDGDSLEIGNRRIRLLDIDAPEYKQYCFDAKKNKYNCGKKAYIYLKEMVKNANYRVECYSESVDRYNRELAECFANNKNLNIEMLRAGLAITYRSNKKEYFAAEKMAKRNKNGLWNGKFMRPEYYRKLNKR